MLSIFRNFWIFMDMKRFILFMSIISLTSCSILKNKTPKKDELKDINDISSLTDSVYYSEGVGMGSVEPKIAYTMMEAPNPNKVIITSSNIIIPNKQQPKEYKPDLKIVKIDNNKILIKTINDGHVVYKIPQTMNIRNTSQVLLRISKSKVNIYENLNGLVRTTTIPLTETMEVKLIDPSPIDNKMFDIICDNDAEQIVENNEEVTQWTWNVTPLKIGNANLKIVISIIKGGHKKEVVYEDVVNVKMDINKQVSYFFGKYWQWLLTTIIIPFCIWYYNKRKKNKKK